MPAIQTAPPKVCLIGRGRFGIPAVSGPGRPDEGPARRTNDRSATVVERWSRLCLGAVGRGLRLGRPWAALPVALLLAVACGGGAETSGGGTRATGGTREAAPESAADPAGDPPPAGSEDLAGARESASDAGEETGGTSTAADAGGSAGSVAGETTVTAPAGETSAAAPVEDAGGATPSTDDAVPAHVHAAPRGGVFAEFQRGFDRDPP